MSVLERLPRPLDPVRSIKLKLSIVLLGSGAVGVAYLWWQHRWLPPYPDTGVTVVLVLLSAQVLAHGMTSPLREMTTPGGFGPPPATRSASWPGRSTRWPPSWPPRTSGAAS
jgi:hypothetical protein